MSLNEAKPVHVAWFALERARVALLALALIVLTKLCVLALAHAAQNY